MLQQYKHRFLDNPAGVSTSYCLLIGVAEYGLGSLSGSRGDLGVGRDSRAD